MTRTGHSGGGWLQVALHTPSVKAGNDDQSIYILFGIEQKNK